MQLSPVGEVISWQYSVPVMTSQSALQGVYRVVDKGGGGGKGCDEVLAGAMLWLAQMMKPCRATVLSDCHYTVSPAFIHTLKGPVLRNVKALPLIET